MRWFCPISAMKHSSLQEVFEVCYIYAIQKRLFTFSIQSVFCKLHSTKLNKNIAHGVHRLSLLFFSILFLGGQFYEVWCVVSQLFFLYRGTWEKKPFVCRFLVFYKRYCHSNKVLIPLHFHNPISLKTGEILCMDQAGHNHAHTQYCVVSTCLSLKS